MKTIFIVVAIFGLSVGEVFARPPKVTEPLFEGQPDDAFAEWVAEKIGFPAILDAPAMADVEPFWVHFKIDETGAVVDVGDPKKSLSQLEFLVRTALLTSPEWTPAFDRKTPQLVGYNLFMRPAERTLRLLKVEDCEVVMPAFQGGGIMEFRDWVTDHLVYPEAVANRHLTGRVVVRFVVEKDGSVTVDEILEATWRELVEEVVRVLKSAPKWNPGSFEGIPTTMNYVLPIDFKM